MASRSRPHRTNERRDADAQRRQSRRQRRSGRERDGDRCGKAAHRRYLQIHLFDLGRRPGSSAGCFRETVEIASGTVMLFMQTAAPTGWTKSTTHNNKAIRIVSGTATSSGGSTAFTSAIHVAHGRPSRNGRQRRSRLATFPLNTITRPHLVVATLRAFRPTQRQTKCRRLSDLFRSTNNTAAAPGIRIRSPARRWILPSNMST